MHVFLLRFPSTFGARAGAMFSLALLACSSTVVFTGQEPTRQRVPARAGKAMSIGVSIETVDAPDAVSLLRVDPVQKSAELEVVDIVAFRPSRLGAMISSDEYPPGVFPGRAFEPHPVTDIKLVPGKIPDWQLLVVLRSYSIGVHRILGLRVTYRIGKRTQAQVWPHTLELEVVDCSLEANQQTFACRGGSISPRGG